VARRRFEPSYWNTRSDRQRSQRSPGREDRDRDFLNAA
jgi:hypothetical protein